MPGDHGEAVSWLSTKDAAERLGVTLRSLYRFIDEGGLAAYKFGRVIRLKEVDVEAFIESSRIVPGSLEHLYPEVKGAPRVVHGVADGRDRMAAEG
ncbi:MAG: helix-turn-helix domain-containing protein [Acidimicrobiales bacterium]|jgi:excisionase family DNA binding protein